MRPHFFEPLCVNGLLIRYCIRQSHCDGKDDVCNMEDMSHVAELNTV